MSVYHTRFWRGAEIVRTPRNTVCPHCGSPIVLPDKKKTILTCIDCGYFWDYDNKKIKRKP